MCPARYAERIDRSRPDPTPERSASMPAPLVVGAADDRAEREADRVAGEVIARLHGAEPAGAAVHTHGAACDHGDVRRSEAPVGEAEVGHDGGEVSPELIARIESRRGSGSALGGAVRRRLEAGFGQSLGDVRIHTDGESAALNRAVSARAFTTGTDIFFGAGEFRPDTPEGEQVLAHEIAHTRQGGGAARRTIRRWDMGAKKLDLRQASKMGVVGSGQSVYFLTDAHGHKIAVKTERHKIGLAELAGQMHEQFSGVSSVRHRQLDKDEIAGLMDVFNNTAQLDQEDWSRLGAMAKKHHWFRGDVATQLKIDKSAVDEVSDFDAGRALHQWKLDPPPTKMMAMTFAEGETAGRSATKQDADPYGQPALSRMRGLMSDFKHVQHLGLLTAVDLFMGNRDRVHAGNLGNWFYDPQSHAMTVIDHIDDSTAGVFDNRKAQVELLDKKSLRSTAADSVEAIADGIEREGDKEFKAWIDADGQLLRKRMEEAMVNGLVDGRKLLVKTFTATRFSGSSKARAVKKSIKQAGREAGGVDGGADKDDYYKTLKRRAEWLKKH